MICPNCGKTISQEANFCTYCGTRIKAGEPADTSYPPDDRYPPDPVRVWFCCPKCGSRFERHGDKIHLPEFGRCFNCGYTEK